MTPREVRELIERGLEGARVEVVSEDNVHFSARVITPAFAGKRPLQRHQLVYGALGAAMGNEIHALALEVYTPDEFASRSLG